MEETFETNFKIVCSKYFDCMFELPESDVMLDKSIYR